VIERHRAYVVEKAAAMQLKTQVEERAISAIRASLQTEIDEHRHRIAGARPERW
jgi:hypothetical protein